MPFVQRIARPLISGVFVTSGINHLRNPAAVAPIAQRLTSKLTDTVPVLPKDTAKLVRINAVGQVSGGLLLTSNRWHRVGAGILIGTLIPTTVAGHSFWEVDDAETRAMQKTHFYKNLAILGGLLLELVDRGGKPSLGWRAKHKAAEAGALVTASRLPIG